MSKQDLINRGESSRKVQQEKLHLFRNGGWNIKLVAERRQRIISVHRQPRNGMGILIRSIPGYASASNLVTGILHRLLNPVVVNSKRI